MKPIRPERRKAIHYSLLGAIVLLQLLTIAIWYNESRLSRAFGKMSESNKILTYTNRLNSELLESQTHFNDYIARSDKNSLSKYSASVDRVKSLVDSLGLFTRDAEEFAHLLDQKKELETRLADARNLIDSIVGRQLKWEVSNPKSFSFDGFASDNFLDNVETKTYITVKDADKKGFFSRIGDAISGKVRVKKEYINTVVTVNYQDRVLTGDVESQMEQMLKLSDAYYKKEFDKLQRAFSNLKEGDRKLMALNNKLLAVAQKASASYNRYPNFLGDSEKVRDQYESAQAVRNYGLVLLILLMLGISVILIYYTRSAFETQRKLTLARDRISKSLDFKNRITGVISHEIRSPLGIISYYSKNARSATDSPEMREMLRSIEFTTNSLQLLSSQILEYSKDETRPIELKSKPFMLKPEIEAITGSMRALVEPRGNKLEVQIQVDDEEVSSDLARIHQLFYNIVGNANKFTDGGTISIDVRSKRISEFEVELLVKVSDDGAGIAPDDLAHIFDSHYQGVVSENVNDLGIGLGLNICKEIVSLFDGEITIESELGVGTLVSFNLIIGLS